MKKLIVAAALAIVMLFGALANWGCIVSTPVGLLKACGDPKIRASSWSTKRPPTAFGGQYFMNPSDFGHKVKPA